MTVRPRLLGAAFAAAALPSAVMAADDDWAFRFTPYVWSPDMSTDLDIGASPPTSSDVGFFDVLDAFFLSSFEARKGDWGLTGEFNYLALSQHATPRLSIFAADIALDGYMIALAGTYRVYRDEDSTVDLLAGARYWDLEPSIDFDNFGKFSTNKSWVDPIVGVRVSHNFTPEFFMEAQGNIGGFSVGSQFQWEALARAGYRFNDTVTGAVGYRHLDLDFDDDGLLLNMTLTGPFVAVDFNF